MSEASISGLVRPGVRLAELTTIGLGGPPRYFVPCRDITTLRNSLLFARHNKLRLQILGSGSNTIFADSGFDGLVIRMESKGKRFEDDEDHAIVEAAAGEDWDSLVSDCVQKGFGGIECLSGIPGMVGATPIQNVGAYGQEVSDTILSVGVLDVETLESREMNNTDCQFAYRQSRFKRGDHGRFVITGVRFRLRRNGTPVLRYPELRQFIESGSDFGNGKKADDRLVVVRNAVLSLRRKKSMVIHPDDPNCKSVGSFFMNPVLEKGQFDRLTSRWLGEGNPDPIPSFPFAHGLKVPAAWLVEHAGFPKGFRKGGVGISSNHALALVNHSGSTAELLNLSEEIRAGVKQRFGILLEIEPVVVV